MVKIADIKDRESLEAWLENQPREVSVWIASRAAVRVLPVWWRAVLTEDWARRRELTGLPVLRSVLISTVAALVPNDGIRSAAAAASAALSADADVAVARARAATVAHSVVAEARSSAARAAGAALASSDAAALSADTADANARAVDAAATARVWPSLRTDAKQASGGQVPEALPLWPDGQNPLKERWSDIKAQVVDAPDARDWQFWIDWYDALLEGRTMLPDPARTWEMLEKIALIDAETWDAGPETVNPRIREIWESYKGKAPRELEVLQAADDGIVLGYNVETDRFYQEDIKPKK